MSEADLKKLKFLTTPDPDAGAKELARAAALASFNEVDAAPVDSAMAPQENASSARPTHIDPIADRRSVMRITRFRPVYAVAASVVALAICVPLALQFADIDQFSSPQDVQSRVQSEPKIINDPTSLAKADRLTKSRADSKPRSETSTSARQRVAKAKPSTGKPSAAASQVAGGRKLADLRTTDESQRAVNELKQRMGTLTVARDGRLVDSRQFGSQVVSVAPAAGAPEANKQLLAEQPQPVVGFFSDHDQLPQAPPKYEGRDRFESIKSNALKAVASDPVATFSSDVDTASYGFVRRMLKAGRLPQKNAVRIEELINYFSYDYGPAQDREKPFRPQVRVVPSPWNAQTQLMHIAIKGYALKAAERPRANLVFLIDVSGSMQGEDRLPLLKNAFRMLLDSLEPDDTVGLVTYASGSGIALKPTKVSEKATILAAIDRLGAGGSTAGARGIRDAYALAEANFDKAAVNRVILGTDGDFNVGISNRDELKSYIEAKRKSGIFLSVLGVGRGNYNDALMQALAQNGNGTAAYIDTISEARKVLVEESSSTLFPIARDVKFQIEFNPARVSHYRLIGYETRALRREDFNNDKVDAGDIGSGHAVTAIFEIVPAGAKQKLVDGLRYQPSPAPAAAAAAAAKPDAGAEFAFLKIRYKLPSGDKSKLIALPVTPAMQTQSIDAVAEDARFSIAVAAFGQLLRGGTHMQDFGYDDVIALAGGAKGTDPYGIRAEFVNLVRLAKSAR